ncbi:peptide ABC transporter substrate-binding protein [Enterococcus faecalis]|jgi:ABC-type oligopeptide transport system, periplasmic component|uniref:peptide ABC transporter substrate-binding protein n=1 Tax=Enterococcus TaxID=1350 RepID=UPI0002050F0A|nr:peptide ABC transporter substrate-binding protein [Enterococcus faecalis]AEA95037.1 oligopeptide ABC superfamily ATP binding cassette transporter, binding protein [Enterococcus faecalis OG1RF]AZV35074.1 peptide ABC transporter substrate-binding protein [Enterococcus faecalis OG1RF]AZV97917.1 peptide ABC transporter substrate-binding protein [Enterococcus faecalis]EGO2748675.1 peptide ABC transporter substrate-binding protein [Enterococcus faecalis]EGO2848851.1 peptide ABC transporter substr
MKLGKKVVGLIATGFLLAACGGTKEAAEKVDSGNLAAEQKISISSPAPISTLDTTQTTDKNTFTMAQHLFEGLYRFDDDSATVPALAKDVKISDDGRKYHFTLREGIKWSNGEPITAQDFVYSWKKLVTPATIGPNAYLLDSVKNSFEIRNGEKSVDELGISAPNDKEFIVELKQAQPSFLAVVSIAWLAPQNQKFVEAQGKDYALDSEHLLYSGPFTLANWDATSDTWTLKKNPEYYDADQVKLEEVAVSTIKEDNTGINLYQANELDLVRINGQYVQQYQDDPGYVSHPDVANYFLDFNKKEGTPLANVHLRKAIGQAIDKEALTQSVLNDGSNPLNGLIPSKLYANPETDEDFRAYSGEYLKNDVKKAQAEWTKAQADVGKKVKLSLLAADTDQGKRIAEYVQSQLQENLPGLEITISSQPSNNVNQSRREKNYELSLSGWIAGSSELDSYFNLYAGESSYNYGNYHNAKYDQLVEDARTINANNPEKQFAEYKEAEDILLNQDAAQVPLYQSASNYLINPKLKGISYHLYGDYFHLRNAYLTE